MLSADGGVTFPTLVSGGSTMAISGDAAHSFRAGGAAGSAYLLGQGGEIEATTNGGASWAVLRTPSSSDLVDAAFPTTSAGYAITADGVLPRPPTAGRHGPR